MYIDYITKTLPIKIDQTNNQKSFKKYQKTSNSSKSQQFNQHKHQEPLINKTQDYIQKVILITDNHIALLSNTFIRIAKVQNGQIISIINSNYFIDWIVKGQNLTNQTGQQNQGESNFQECSYSVLLKKFLAVVFYKGFRYFVVFDLSIQKKEDQVQLEIKQTNQINEDNFSQQVQVKNVQLLYSFRKFPVKYGLQLQPRIMCLSKTGTLVLVRKFYSDSLLVVFKYDQQQKLYKEHWNFSINEECVSNLDQTKYLINYRQYIQKNYLQIQIVDVEQKHIRNLKIEQNIEPCTIYGILRSSLQQNDLSITILINIRRCKKSAALKYNTNHQITEDYVQYENQQFQEITRINNSFLLLIKSLWKNGNIDNLPENKIQIIHNNSLLLKSSNNLSFNYDILKEQIFGQTLLHTFLVYSFNVSERVIFFDVYRMIKKNQHYLHILTNLNLQIESKIKKDATEQSSEIKPQNKACEVFKLGQNLEFLQQIYGLL